MTTPFQFPNIHQGQTIQDPGIGGAIASSLAQVLAAQQAQREEQYRQQVLAQKQQEAQQQAAYQQGMLGVQQGELQAKNAEAAAKTRSQQQVGGAMRQYLTSGGQPPAMGASPTQVPGQPQATEQGAFTQVLQGGAQAIAPAAGHPDIFGGVADENLPAAVEGVQNAQQLTPKPPTPTGDMQNFEYLMRLASRDPKRAMLFKQLFIDKQPSTVINNIPAKGETKFTEHYGELQADLLNSTVKDAKIAYSDIPRQREAYNLVDKTFTGVGANAKLNVGRVLSAMGVPASKDDVENTQSFLRLQREGTLNWLRTRALGSGNAVSNQDREYMDRVTGADITLDAGALKKIIRINYGTNLMKIKDAVDDLHDKAISYPANAADFNRQARALQRQYDSGWDLYTQMKANENKAVDDLSHKLRGIPGLQLPGMQ